MKFAVAQIRPVKADIHANIERHKKLIDLAIAEKVGLLVFPELSITSYEPGLARSLAMQKEDIRLNEFQKISKNNLAIGIGLPTCSDDGTLITMLIFQPNAARQSYSKQFLHADEKPFFVEARDQPFFQIGNKKIAMAICYELSIPEHAEKAAANGADLYIVSVAKSASGMTKASETLASIAKKYSMTVLLSNAVGYCDNFEAAGQSSIWSSDGLLKEQLNEQEEGLLLIDINTGKTSRKTLP